MAIWQGKSKRKPTGGRLISSRAKRRFEISNELQDTKIGTSQNKLARTRGGGSKLRVLRGEHAIITDSGKGKSFKSTIQEVIENPANLNYVRQNIITKGAVIMTDAGKARVTSRPGQNGSINAVLID